MSREKKATNENHFQHRRREGPVHIYDTHAHTRNDKEIAIVVRRFLYYTFYSTYIERRLTLYRRGYIPLYECNDAAVCAYRYTIFRKKNEKKKNSYNIQ